MFKHLEIQAVPAFAPITQLLVRELDAELAAHHSVTEVYGLSGLDDVDPSFLVARVDGDAVGYAAYCRFDDNTVELRSLYVRKSMRGLGIGKSLLAELEHYAANQGFSIISLESAAVYSAAVQLCKSIGYQKKSTASEQLINSNNLCFEKGLSTLALA